MNNMDLLRNKNNCLPTFNGMQIHSSNRSETDRLTMKTNVGVEFLIQRRRPIMVVMLPEI